jgi:hypothetical protein
VGLEPSDRDRHEIKAAMHGAIASYGTSSVDEAHTLQIDGSTHPNLEGTSSN